MNRSLTYRTFARTLSAGLPLTAAIDLTTSPAHPNQHFTDSTNNGTATERLAATVRIPGEELELLRSAEDSGRLPDVLEHLAGRLERRTARQRRLLVGLIYPTLLLHVLVAALHAPKIVRSPVAFVAAVGGTYVQFWLVLGLIVGPVVWLLRTPGGRRKLIDLGSNFPFVGGGLRRRAAADYADHLALQLSAGQTLFVALRCSAELSFWSPLRAAGLAVLTQVQTHGATLSEAFQSQRVLPTALQQAVRVGEQSGRLEETVSAAARSLEEAADRRATALAIAVPVTLYLGTALMIAWFAITTFSSLLSGLP